jgi:DNA-binding transcriptional LysR family regulator
LSALAAFQAAGLMPERIYQTSLLQTGMLLVGAGLGMSLVPESFRRMKVQRVTYRPLATASPMIDLIAAWRRGNTSALLAHVRQKIRADCAALLATV